MKTKTKTKTKFTYHVLFATRSLHTKVIAWNRLFHVAIVIVYVVCRRVGVVTRYLPGIVLAVVAVVAGHLGAYQDLCSVSGLVGV